MLKHTLTQNALYRVDIIYSIIWMKATGKDKYAYRDESKIHALIMKWMCHITLNQTTKKRGRSEKHRLFIM